MVAQAREITQPSYFRTGKNLSGAAIGKNLVVDAGATQDEIVLPAGVTSLHVGVTEEDVPDQGTRSIQTEGKAKIKTSAAIAINTMVQAGTDGRIATAATSSTVIGITKQAATAANDVIEVELWKGRFIAP
jgi:type IV pilus biogenesis protein CpaD/CtpE